MALGKLGVPEEMIRLIKSFHQDMHVGINLYRKVMEEIRAQNGLRQVGFTVEYKYDGKQFRRCARNAREKKITQCQFADHGGHFASTRSGAKRQHWRSANKSRFWHDSEHLQDNTHGDKEEETSGGEGERANCT